ncbi:unnamed protein product [Caretta caretta]
MDTPATGDLVTGRPSSEVTAGSGQREDNRLRREDPGDLTSRFQPVRNKDGCEERLREEEAQAACLPGTEDKGQRWVLGEVMSDAQVEGGVFWARRREQPETTKR